MNIPQCEALSGSLLDHRSSELVPAVPTGAVAVVVVRVVAFTVAMEGWLTPISIVVIVVTVGVIAIIPTVPIIPAAAGEGSAHKRNRENGPRVSHDWSSKTSCLSGEPGLPL